MTYIVNVKHSLLGLGYYTEVSEERLAWFKANEKKPLCDGESFEIVSVKAVG